MMGINFEITTRTHREIDQTMSRHLLQHVLKEWDIAIQLHHTAAIEIKRHDNLGFAGLAMNFGGPFVHIRFYL